MKRGSQVTFLPYVKFYSDAATRFQTAICVTDSIAVLFAKSKYGACTEICINNSIPNSQCLAVARNLKQDVMRQ